MAIFYLQLITTFFLAGFFIAFLTILAERFPKWGGIIVFLPSTVPIALFFIGLSKSPADVFEAVDTIPVGLGATMVFVTAFIYFSKLFSKRLPAIIVGLLVGWFLCFLAVTPLLIYKTTDLGSSLIIFLILVAITGYFLCFRFPAGIEIEKTSFHYSRSQIVLRAVFAGLLMTIPVYLAKMSGNFWGGLFSGFPAAATPTFIILRFYKNFDFLAQIGKTLPVGILIICFYAILAKYLFPGFGIVIGTFLSYSACLLVIFLLRILMNKTRQGCYSPSGKNRDIREK